MVIPDVKLFSILEKMKPHLNINLGVCRPVGKCLQTLAHLIVREDVKGGKGYLDQHSCGDKI